jgi:threonyl-tRNA synthetase
MSSPLSASAAQNINLTLPDGSVRTVPAGVTGMDVATQIAVSLGKAAVAIKLDGVETDLSVPITQDAKIEIIKRDSEAGLELIRHDCAHVLAEAVQALFPGTQVTIGPVIEHGFYYDFYRPEQPFTTDDFAAIEKKMHDIVDRASPFVREVWDRDRAIQYFTDKGELFKAELIRDLPADAPISVYDQGGWLDLCRGPHMPTTKHVGHAFKLMKVAGAYWRGDSNREVLSRIYGTAWRTDAELAAHLEFLEEQKKRDHRKIGQDLQLFTFSADVGSGLPIWLPKGTVIRDELERLAREEERRDGYHGVVTPIITKEALYYRSGHLPYYKDDMYQPMDIDGEKFYLRPMNCPHHHQVFLSQPRSYRDLPLRVAEYGNVFRYEASGGLSGLMRTRCFCQNDAHIYCRKDQAKEEFKRVMALHARLYDLLGIKDYRMRLSMPDLDKLDKYVNEPEKWLAAVDIIREAMNESGLPYIEVPGEAAFYGPKIDFMIKSVIGVEYAISTNQLDFLATSRFNLTYTGEDGGDHDIYVIHRAPLGSHERFTAFLIEHYAGAFPTWLAPVQVKIIPIADRHNDYARTVMDMLFKADVPTATGGLRLEIDESAERMQKKIRDAQLEKAPYALVIGDKEVEQGLVAVRKRNGKDLGAMTPEAFLERVRLEVKNRRDQEEDRQ